MSPLNGDQLQIIRDERKEQIMIAALQIFARRGYIGTKLSMIATKAGISQGLLYHYFKSKDELFILLIQQAIQESIDGMKSVYQLPGSPIEKLRALTRLDNEGQLYFMLIHHARTSDGIPEEAKQLIEQYSMDSYVVDILEPLFIEGQKANEFTQGDPRQLISTYFTVVSALMTLNIHEDEAYQMPEVNLLLRIVTGRP
ncbi:TetR/AcrR family transcriptional regulator [Paenibacillus lupini]|uniref:TetR/AcrR family transcriptional regulator n=1 Tax=Paenibacillus lupini TaxID=1450204 RepID=UPI00141E1832|nr:TetR/AcrR family transcriptional regulator [Paenibacillus lupini]NIK23243.1 AcrR family transcriptional regulator [Paenibacillus lupini]